MSSAQFILIIRELFRTLMMSVECLTVLLLAGWLLSSARSERRRRETERALLLSRAGASLPPSASRLRQQERDAEDFWDYGSR